MYRQFTTIILTWITCVPLIAQQVCVGDVVIQSQAEADAFDCTDVTGTVFISGDVSRLDSLYKLKHVGEDFRIERSQVVSLSGLENLSSLGCSLILKENLKLADISSLVSLDSVDRDVIISYNPVLTSVQGLERIIRLQNLFVFGNKLLNTCCELSELVQRVEGSTDIRDNGENCSLEGIALCDEPEPIVCEGDVLITSQAEADNFNCTVINGDLIIRSFESIRLDSLYELKEVAGDIRIEVNFELPLEGLRNLHLVRGIIYFNTDSEHINLNELVSLQSVRGLNLRFAKLDGLLPSVSKYMEYIKIDFGGEFTNTTWLPAIHVDTLIIESSYEHPDDYLYMLRDSSVFQTRLTPYENLSGLKGIQYLKEFYMVSLPDMILNSLEGMSDLVRVDKFHMEGVTASDCCGLYNLFKYGSTGTIEYLNNFCSVEDILTTCSDEPVVINCNSDVTIKNQEFADACDCTIIDGDLLIESPVSLHLDSLYRLTRVTGDIYFKVDEGFSFYGMQNLQQVDGEINFEPFTFSVTRLNLNELESLRSARGIFVQMATLDGTLPSFSNHLESFKIVYLGEVTNIEWLATIHVDSLTIYDLDDPEEYLYMLRDSSYFKTAVTPYQHFNGISGIHYLKEFNIESVASIWIDSFEGLSDLTRVDKFHMNGVTTDDCCGLYNLFKYGSIGTLEYVDNSCSVEEILSVCSDDPAIINCDDDVTITSQKYADAFNCEIVNGDLNVRSLNPINLDSMYSLTEVRGDVYLRISTEYSLFGLRNLQSVDGIIYFSPFYPEYVGSTRFNLDELNSLQSIRGLDFNQSSLQGSLPSTINDIERFSIHGTSMSNTEWLSSLRTDSLWIYGMYSGVDNYLILLRDSSTLSASYSWFQNFEGLQNIDYLKTLDIMAVNAISLTGMSDLLRVDMFRMNHTRIGDCCGLYNLLKNGSVGSFEFMENSCTVEEILASCGPQEVESLSVFPNPVSGVHVNLQWENRENVLNRIEVIDNQGHVKKNIALPPAQGLLHYELEVNDLPSGIYFIRISGDSVIFHRFIKS